MRTPNKNFYQRPVPKKLRLRGDSFLTFFGGVSIIVGILALTVVGFWDSFTAKSPIPQKALQPLLNPPGNIPNAAPSNLAVENDSTMQKNSYLKPILGDKGQIQLVSLQRVLGKTDEVNLKMRIYRQATEVTATDTINIGNISAKNSISGDTYQPVDPINRSSGIIKLADIPVGKSVDAYVVLRVPRNAIVLDIITDNITQFKNALIGIDEPVTTNLNNNPNNSALPPVSGISGLPKAPIPGNTAYPLPSAMENAKLPEVTVKGNPQSQDIGNAIAIAIGQTPATTTTNEKPTNQAPTNSSVPVSPAANSTNQQSKSATDAPTLPPAPTLVNPEAKSQETNAPANITLADKAAPTFPDQNPFLEKSSGFNPGEFAQLAYGNKARVELISVQRIPDPKSGEPDMVTVQMRISRLDEKVVESNVIKVNETTARNSVSEQSYKPVNSLENVPLPVALKDIPQNTSIDTYVWLKVPKGVYAIDIYVPEAGAFKNVPITP
jgi:hypothetical protein